MRISIIALLIMSAMLMSCGKQQESKDVSDQSTVVDTVSLPSDATPLSQDTTAVDAPADVSLAVDATKIV